MDNEPMDTQGPAEDGAAYGSGDTLSTGKQLVKRAAVKARGKLEEQVVTYKSKLVQRAQVIGDAIEVAGTHLREHGEPALADYVVAASSRVKSLTDYVDGREVQELVTEARDFAREHPRVIVASTLLVGILAARMARAGVAHG